MPRQAKDKKELVKEKNTKKVAASKKTTEKKKTVAKKTTTKAKSTTTKKSATKSTTAKKSTVKKITAKKSTTKKTSASKKIEVVEYYDLPYKYNETVVRLLAQTPEILFVYWDISDEDKNKYIEKYGEFFFNDTKPVLIVTNKTKNYSFEVDINDYANSWYLHISDSDCDYAVELGRRPINEYAKIDDYMPISYSNKMDAPNDHILFDTLSNSVYFKNVKTGITTSKDVSLYFVNRIAKMLGVRDFYKKMYKDENIDFEKLNLQNMPSS